MAPESGAIKNHAAHSTLSKISIGRSIQLCQVTWRDYLCVLSPKGTAPPQLGVWTRRDSNPHLLLGQNGKVGDHNLVFRCPKLGKGPVHIWQRFFYDFNVWTEHKRIEKLRYIHRNPVARGLVAEPEQRNWSSFRAHAFGEIGPVQINQWQVLKMKIRAG